MTFFFELEDRIGQRVSIPDPVGWDSMTFVLERDPGGKHGVFFQFQSNPFTYDGDAGRILRDEFETFGIEGEMYLIISFDCGTGIETLDKMRFVFSTYEQIAGSECSVVMTVETLNDALVLRNRIDQKVNLMSTVAFDELTPLVPYPFLPKTISIPSKSILVQDSSENGVLLQETYTGSHYGAQPGEDAAYGLRQMLFSVPAYAVKVSSELGNYVHPTDAAPPEPALDPTSSADIPMATANWDNPLPVGYAHLPYGNGSTSPDYSFDRVFPLDRISPIINYDASFNGFFGPIAVTIEGRFRKRVESWFAFGTTVTKFDVWGVYLGILPVGYDGTSPSHWRWLSLSNSVFDVHPFVPNVYVTDMTADFTFSFNVTLNPGDRVYFFDKVGYRKRNIYSTTVAMQINYDPLSYFKTSGLTTSPPTDVKLFLLNEAFSHVSEAITNGKFPVYSEFFGRVDSLPFPVAADGCGSHTAITTGLFLRRMEERNPATPPIFSISMREIWDGVNPVYNLGLGVEPDPSRPGEYRVRIESWRHFYQDTVILVHTNVNDIKRSILPGEHVSVFKFGYTKWEAEAFSGIDEFLTNREYRTELSQVNQTFSAVSTFIASSFAIEVTRRKGNLTSEDWRYDKDVFLFALERSSTTPNAPLVVQQGDIFSPAHIVDPATQINFRLKPSTFAFRWMPYVLKGYRQAGFSDKIIFTDGAGNVYAEGYLSETFCPLIAGPISEKQDLSPSLMNVPTDGLPVSFPERVVYTHPMTLPEWNDLRQNPFKMIDFSNEQDDGFAWIERVEYRVNDGIANFRLIPSR